MLEFRNRLISRLVAITSYIFLALECEELHVIYLDSELNDETCGKKVSRSGAENWMRYSVLLPNLNSRPVKRFNLIYDFSYEELYFIKNWLDDTINTIEKLSKNGSKSPRQEQVDFFDFLISDMKDKKVGLTNLLNEVNIIL